MPFSYDAALGNNSEFVWFKQQVIKMFSSVLGIIATPGKQWHSFAGRAPESAMRAAQYTLLLAIIPTVAWYWGTTQVGWEVGAGDTVKLSAGSARSIFPLFYLAMVSAIIFIGFMIHWMASNYGADSSAGKGIAIAGLAATPLFLAGVVGFYPVFWLALVLGVGSVCYTMYLLYLGIPIVMKIPEERAFLFASAIVAVCMVAVIAMMGASVILWDMGLAPVFTDG